MNAESKKRYKEIDFPFTCPVTNRTFSTNQGLACYVTKTLKTDHSIYYDKYINHRDKSCFFCGGDGLFISISRGYRNLCEDPECMKKSFKSHSVEGFMYRNNCSREEAQKLFELENGRQLEERIKTQNILRTEDPLWDKKRSRNCKEFWIKKGYSEEESIQKSKEVMVEIHQKTFQKFKDNPEKYVSKYDTKIEYYLNKGYSEKDSLILLSDRQSTFSLEICIEKYGNDLGQKIWLDRQEKWQLSIQNGGSLKGGFSGISQDLFDKIVNNYQGDIYYWTRNKEFYLKSNKSIYLYDFTDFSKMRIIEYNGDRYHANPNIYTADDKPHPYRDYTSFQIWEKDKRKIELANLNGFEVLTIWDSEYRKDKEKILQRCLDFLKN